jgi:predicted nucleotide-binding protein
MSKIEQVKLYSQALLEYANDCPAWVFQDIKLHLITLFDFGCGKKMQSKESLNLHLTELRQFHKNLLQRHYPTYCLTTVKMEALEKCLKSILLLNTAEFQLMLKPLYGQVGKETTAKINTVFVGHGQSRSWGKLIDFLRTDMAVPDTVFFDKPFRIDQVTRESLSGLIKDLDFAIIVLTAEDELIPSGRLSARSQALYELAYMQGCLGDDRVAVLRQEGVEPFTEVQGIDYITYSKDKIEQSFYELSRKFKMLSEAD